MLPIPRLADSSNSVGAGCGSAYAVVQGAIAADHVLRLARLRAEQLLRFRHFPRDGVPIVMGHDGPQSRALQQTAAWFDFPVWAYRRRSPVPPKTQIINLLQAERPVIGVFVDSGGPDGQVRPGFLEVARAAEALLVPMTWHASPVLVLRSPGRRYYFPAPFSHIRGYYGLPIDGRSATPDGC